MEKKYQIFRIYQGSIVIYNGNYPKRIYDSIEEAETYLKDLPATHNVGAFERFLILEVWVKKLGVDNINEESL